MKRKNSSLIIICCICFGLIFLYSCNRNTDKNSDTPTTGEITIVADETFKPILDSEIDVFRAIYKFAKINAVYKTETEAINDILRDSVRLIISSRPLKKDEIEFFHAKQFYPQELKIAIDGIALITNRENPDSIISVQNFLKILKGEITSWRQINEASSNEAIKVVFDNKNSSTVRFMLDSLLQNSDISSKHAALEHNQQVIDYVAENKNTIGVIGLSWISDKDDTTMMSFLKKVRVMALSRDSVASWANSYQPYQAYIARGFYPLSRDIYVINSDPRKGLTHGFAAFLASERGQRIILKTGILPATQPYRIIEVKEY